MFRRSATVAALVLGATVLAGPAFADHDGEEVVPSYPIVVGPVETTTPGVTRHEDDPA